MSGEIITFYSYKGGTGRSMLLSNVAWILASHGKRVLMMDWDLEAPGLHRYFHPFLRDGHLADTPGLIEWLTDYRETVSSLIDTAGELPSDVLSALSDPCNYALQLDTEPFDITGFGALHLVPAGRQDGRYADRVNRFDFSQFYDQLGAPRFLRSLRERAIEQYDYVLIDSRTGVADTAGISTLAMPDKLVVCFTLNSQSILGASGVARSARLQRGDGFAIYPVPTRIDRSEKLKLDIARDEARKAFAGFPTHLAGDLDGTLRYWGQVEVPYESFYAYEEVLATFGDPPGAITSMLASAERLAGYLTGIGDLAPADESIRKDILSRYLRRREGVVDISQIADSVFTAMQAAEQAVARNLLTRFVYLGPNGEVFGRPVAKPIPNELTAVCDRFEKETVIVSDNQETPPQYRLVDAMLPAKWNRMRGWVSEDRAFIQWRLDLESRMAAFQRQNRNPDLYLTETEVGYAVPYVESRKAECTAEQLDFVRQSQQHRAAEGQRIRQLEVRLKRALEASARPDETEGPSGERVRGKNIVLCADDGRFRGREPRTNVYHILGAIDQYAPDDAAEQVGIYDDGIGARDFPLLRGLARNLRLPLGAHPTDLYLDIARLYTAGDRVFLFGFGRSAATVRELAELIARIGIIDRRKCATDMDLRYRLRDGHELHDRLMRRDFGAGDREMVLEAVRRFRAKYSVPETVDDAPIQFVGLWDAAPSRFTFDRLFRPPERQLPYTQLSRCVRRVCHALAIDEHREPFLWSETDAAEGISQVWFSGSRASVGGGRWERALSSAPLVWMMRQAEQAGLRISQESRETIIDKQYLVDYLHASGYDPFPRPRRIADICAQQGVMPRIHVAALQRIANTDRYFPGNFPPQFAVEDDNPARGEALAHAVSESFERFGYDLRPREIWLTVRNITKSVIWGCVLLLALALTYIAVYDQADLRRFTGLPNVFDARFFAVIVLVVMLFPIYGFAWGVLMLRQVERRFWRRVRPELQRIFSETEHTP